MRRLGKKSAVRSLARPKTTRLSIHPIPLLRFVVSQTIKGLVKFPVSAFFGFAFEIIHRQVGRKFFRCGTTEELVDGNDILFGNLVDLVVDGVWQPSGNYVHLAFFS